MSLSLHRHIGKNKSPQRCGGEGVNPAYAILNKELQLITKYLNLVSSSQL
jgi:hypothetical protein